MLFSQRPVAVFCGILALCSAYIHASWCLDTPSKTEAKLNSCGQARVFTPAGMIHLQDRCSIHMFSNQKLGLRDDKQGIEYNWDVIGTCGQAGSGDGPEWKSIRLIDMDRQGNVFVVDRGLKCVKRITPHGNVSTVAGTCGSSASEIKDPVGVDVMRNGNLLVNDYTQGKVYEVSANDPSNITLLTVNGIVQTFQGPDGMDAATDGTIYVADWDGNGIKKISPDGSSSSIFSASKPLDTAVESTGTILITAGWPGSTITRISPSGQDLGRVGSSAVVSIMGVNLDSQGRALAINRGTGKVYRIASDGSESILKDSNGDDISVPGAYNAVEAPNGDIIVGDTNQKCVKRFNGTFAAA